MGLKSREWFFGECYKQVRKKGKLEQLANKSLELGFKKEMTGGHILQACGAAQMFLHTHPEYIPIIKRSPTRAPFKVTGQVLDDWLEFIGSKRDKYSYGQRRFQYSWDSLRTYLTPKYGGRHRGGGGGNDKLEIVLRLMAEFV